MRLLTDYLNAIGVYLHGRQRRDILRELEENLISQLEEQEAELGRPLTEPEQQAILLAHGTPLEVAARYGSHQGTFTFGRQLIGPEFFPIYLRVLLANWIISVVIHSGIALSHVDVDEPRAFLLAVTVQFIVVTVIFCVVDVLQRRSGGVPASLGDHYGHFPPTDPLYKTLDDSQKRRLSVLTRMDRWSGGRGGWRHHEHGMGMGRMGMDRDFDRDHDRRGHDRNRYDRDDGPDRGGPERL